MRASDCKDIVRLHGECDLYSAAGFLSEARVLMDKGVRTMLVDCSGLIYLDSTGVGAIVRILQQMKSLGGSVFFRSIKGPPRKVLELCNVIMLLREVPED